jgi:Tol biopolymer transport system component
LGGTLPDPRWQNRSWSELFIYDINKNHKSKLTKSQRLFSPIFSTSGDQVAVIAEHSDGSSSLQVINIQDGHVICDYLQKTMSILAMCAGL